MKKYTKRTVVILSSMLLMVIASGCEKYLDVKQTSSLGADEAFSDVATATTAITGIYNELIGDNGYGIRISCYYGMGTDEMECAGNFSCDTRRGFSMYEVCASNTDLERPFEQLYRGVEKANNAIKYIPLSDLYQTGDETQKAAMQRLYGEALALRAQFYYELIRNWGDVPFHQIPAADEKDLFLPRTDRDEIYEVIIIITS